MKTKTFLQDYFYYTRTERNGALALCVFSVALLFAPYILQQTVWQKQSPDFHVQFVNFEYVERSPVQVNPSTDLFNFNPNTVTKEEMIQLGLTAKLAQTVVNFRNKGGYFRRKEDLLKIYGLEEADYQRLEPYIQVNSAEIATLNGNYSSERKPVSLFTFDPNTASKEDYIKLGLPEKTAATILKFREKGGNFRQKEDLKKIYGLKSKDYERLAPFIRIEQQGSEKQHQTTLPQEPIQSPDFKKQTRTSVAIDINQATAEEWQTLRGIGPAYAKRITNFREKLGGFIDVEQVKETYGLPDSIFQAIKMQLKASPVFRKIAINEASLEELKAHPYIDARKAAAIVSYREQHGAFRTLDDLRQMKALPTDWLDKLGPYLQFD
ncbi:MAG: helix-hairpin-helix domain-containing protein [Saprospiraceae bacterium]